MIFTGYAIWENIQKNLDAMFKETGVKYTDVVKERITGLQTFDGFASTLQS